MATSFNRVEIELTGRPSTGYEWQSSRQPEDVSYESRYPSENEKGERRYGGQVFTKFVFQDVPPGTELVFSYGRKWDKDMDPQQVVRVRVGEERAIVPSELENSIVL